MHERKAGVLSAYGTEEVSAAKIVLSPRDVSGPDKAGLYQGKTVGNMVAGADCKHTVGEGAAFNKDDLPMDLREVHRRESESTEKERKKPRNKGNKRKIQLRENDPKAG